VSCAVRLPWTKRRFHFSPSRALFLSLFIYLFGYWKRLLEIYRTGTEKEEEAARFGGWGWALIRFKARLLCPRFDFSSSSGGPVLERYRAGKPDLSFSSLSNPLSFCIFLQCAVCRVFFIFFRWVNLFPYFIIYY